MLPYKRSQRVGDLVREEVADIIMTRLKDPRIGFVTVTGADMSDDLKMARIFVSILKPEDREQTLSILNDAGLVESRKEGRWIYYQLPGKKAPVVVREALDWIEKSLAGNPHVALLLDNRSNRLADFTRAAAATRPAAP